MGRINTKNILSYVVVGLVGIGTGVYAQTVLPGLHVFEPGTVISSSQVNENFALLNTRLDAHDLLLSQGGNVDSEQLQQLNQILQFLTTNQQQLQLLVDHIENNPNFISSSIAVVNSVNLLEETVQNLNASLVNVNLAIVELEDKTQFMHVVNGDTIFENTNIRVQNGLGVTTSTNGKGNLIVGYDEQDGYIQCFGEAPDRSGSHNVVVGHDHAYSSYASIICGRLNKSIAPYTTVLGCKKIGDKSCKTHNGPPFGWAFGHRNKDCDDREEDD